MRLIAQNYSISMARHTCHLQSSPNGQNDRSIIKMQRSYLCMKISKKYVNHTFFQTDNALRITYFVDNTHYTKIHILTLDGCWLSSSLKCWLEEESVRVIQHFYQITLSDHHTSWIVCISQRPTFCKTVSNFYYVRMIIQENLYAICLWCSNLWFVVSNVWMRFPIIWTKSA